MWKEFFMFQSFQANEMQKKSADLTMALFLTPLSPMSGDWVVHADTIHLSSYALVNTQLNEVCGSKSKFD